MVIRNAGGRVSPDVLTDLAYIGYLSKVVNPGGPRFEVAVSGHVYDVDTGLVTTIIPAAPMHASTSSPTAKST